ncbi:MAG: sugar ABC transporter permease, partial [Clostridiales bacterium]|nr:sugar ABC transporter permease [Candidatus Blautia equi]
MRKVNNKKAVRYNRWGYIFLIPFFLVYIVFSFIPLVTTVYNGFFENFRSGFTQVGPNFVGLANYVKLISSGDLPDYFLNTMIMWVLGFIPQITLSLAIAAWLSDPQMKLKGTGFFKVVIYLPNLIMAASFAMLFFTMFSDNGPINSILMEIGMISKPFKFMSTKWSIRSLVGFMNFLMWTGHTTILLLASILGVDAQLFEAA